MKKFLLLGVAATLISSLSFATIRRIGYAGIQLTGVDFPTFQAAHDASAAGDTIQVYSNAGTLTVTKKIVLIGFGYNFDKHPTLNAIGTNAPSSVSLTFGAGSDGSIATGLSGSFNVGDVSGNKTTVSDITFQRCYGTFYFYNYQTYSLTSNIRIFSSVITGGGMQWNQPTDFPVNNLQVFNCYIAGFNLYLPGTTASFINCVAASPDIIGNGSLGLNNVSALVKNCIIPGAGVSSNINTVYENNFFAEAQPAVLPAGSNNRWGQSWTAIFSGITTANNNASYHGYPADFDENYFVLKSGSPAINAGFNSAGQVTNCGIFGGEAQFVYKPSGVPSVPSIYKLTAPGISATANPYNVTISVKSNN